MDNDLTHPAVGAIADIGDYVRALGARAKAAARVLATAPTQLKNDALLGAAEALDANHASILTANKKDLSDAVARGHDSAFIDRLTVTPDSIKAMAEGIRTVAALPDPIGEISEIKNRPSGIRVGRMRVPLGVIGMIYESRPNVTADAAALCLKSGNACLLRGGSEATHSNRAIHSFMVAGLQRAGLPVDALQLIATADRGAVGAMLTMRGVIDVIIPRGGKSLTSRIAAEARVPVIKHLDGICHVYVDDGADLEMAVAIADNAKTQRYAPCNTVETLLVANRIAPTFLPLIARIYVTKGVEMRVCTETRMVLEAAGFRRHRDATDDDYHTEHLAPIINIRMLAGLDAAMAHIAQYGSAHTDAIVTNNHANAQRFIREVDSSSVLINASTRLADGFEYGLGAEIGISTDKLHARGPVGLEGLTSQKWVVFGDGALRT